MKWFIIILLIIVVGVLSYFSLLRPKTVVVPNDNNSTPQVTISMETINLTAEDGINIVADFCFFV